VRRGLEAGGITYGYAAVKGEPGKRVIVEDEAHIVRRIFADYVAGKRPREIAHELNHEGVAPPRGSDWTGSTINGNTKRGSGIIANELYAGRITWNKVRMIKDPDTGRRISRPNPRSEWQATEVPELRIVESDVFEQAHSIKAGRGGEQPARSRRAKHLLSGLLKCGCCGGGMAIKDTDRVGRRIQCSRMKEAGTCEHRRGYYLDKIERRVLAGLQEQLADPRAIELFMKAYRAERKRLAAAQAAKRSRIERRLAEIEREIDRGTRSLIKGLTPAEAIGPVLTALTQEKNQLAAELAESPSEEIVELHPAAIERYLTTITELETALNRHIRRNDSIAAALHELIESVSVHPRNGEPELKIKGRLAALTGDALFPQRSLSGGLLVAEEGLEPPTHGL
jgi:site-specific DNA recombinase